MARVGLELVPALKELFGKDIPQGKTRQSRCGTSSSYVPIRDVADWARPRLWTKVSESRLQAQWASGQALWHAALAPSLASLGPCLEQWGGVMAMP